MPDGMELPIVLASETISAAKRKCFQIKRAALGITYCVKKFHQYLMEPSFIIIWFPQARKYYSPGHFQDLYRSQLPFSGTNYTSFKGNKSRCVRKTIIFIQCIIDYGHFYDTASSSLLLVVLSNHLYLNSN